MISPLLDRFDKLTIYKLCELFSFLLLMMLYLSIEEISFFTILFILFLIGFFSSISKIIYDFNIAPNLFFTKEKHKTYVVLNTLNNTATIISPLISGYLIYKGAIVEGILLNSVSYLCTFLTITLLLNFATKVSKENRVSWFRGMKESFIFIFNNSRLLSLSISMLLINVALGSFIPIFTIVFSDYPFHLTLSIASICGIITPMYLLKFKEIDEFHSSCICIFLTCIASLLFLLGGFHYTSLGWVLMYTLACSTNVLTSALRAKLIPHELSGRVNSTLRSIIFLGIPISSIFFSKFSNIVESTTILKISTFVLFISLAPIILFHKKNILNNE